MATKPTTPQAADRDDKGLGLTVKEFLQRRSAIKSTMGRAFAFHVEQKEPGAKKSRDEWDKLIERFRTGAPE